MPRVVETTERVLETDLTRREKAALLYIVEFQERDSLGQPPSQVELFERLNSEGFGLVSPEQVQRLANALRRKRLLINPISERRRGRNMVPTDYGRRVAAALRAGA